jgi:hypothetical protein
MRVLDADWHTVAFNDPNFGAISFFGSDRASK